MIDRDKVVKGLELCKEACGMENCPYWNGSIMDGSCMLKLHEDALALLKEQEAKAGTWQWKIHGKAESGGTLGEAICDQCGKSTYATAVKGDLNYCPNCGAKMTERSNT